MKINFQFKFNPLANFSLFEQNRTMSIIKKNQLTIQSRTLFPSNVFIDSPPAPKFALHDVKKSAFDLYRGEFLIDTQIFIW